MAYWPGRTISIEAPDSTALKALSAKLETYVKAIEGLQVNEQITECDFLISTCTEPGTRQFVATWLYRHYCSSKIMGVEAVAVHIVDEWFTTGKARPSSDIELMNARIFADFNRASLVGNRAPGLTLKTRSGENVDVFGGNDYEQDGNYGGRETKNTVLYFYDTGCANCLVQSIMLRNILKDIELDTKLVAVYTGADSLAWDRYVEEKLSPMPDNIEVVHLWDPEMDSDFQRKYGILQTPGMFLVDKNGIILGRKLDAAALALMLNDLADEENYSYGNAESEALFDKLFSTFEGEPGVKEMNSITDLLATKTAGSPAFKTTMGDLLYYYSEQITGRYKEAGAYLIENYILPNRSIWNSEHDSLCVLSYAESFLSIVSKASPGSMIPAIRVKGVMAGSGKSGKSYRLDKLKAGSYIFIYNRMCQSCLIEKEAVNETVASNRKLKVIMVDTCDMDPDSGGEEARLFEAFDLSVFPYILKTGPRGRVAARYLEAGDVR
ncbi:MAG: peroxiredoxin family protein [Candidatus Cryptobacteroides sp.]